LDCEKLVSRSRVLTLQEAAVPKPAVAFVVLILVTSLFAQSPTQRREVVIGSLSLSGVSQAAQADQQDVVNELKSQCCNTSKPEEIKQRIVYAFQERGYFKAKVESLEVVPASQGAENRTIHVSATVKEGRQYRLQGIGFSGAKAFSNNQLRDTFAIADGDIFNTEKIRRGLDDLRKLYVSQGYLNFTPVPNTEANDDTSQISMSIDLDEGKQFHFHFGKLVLDGEEPQAGTGAKLIAAWSPYEGKPYDPQTVDQYWQSIRTLLPPGTRQENTLTQVFDRQAEIVVLRIELPEVK
jgi:outer membrane protein assembly factor BamA